MPASLAALESALSARSAVACFASQPRGIVGAERPRQATTRLRWRRTERRAVIEPEPPDADAAPAYPRFVTDGRGPAYLSRSEGAPRVALPCPEEGSAYALFLKNKGGWMSSRNAPIQRS